MNTLVMSEVVRNASVLLALALVFDVLTTRYTERANTRWHVIAGLIVGMLGVAIMTTPLRLEPGLLFDARSVLLAVSGLFFGATATLIAVAMTALYRISLGGPGTVAGVLVIISSAVIGLAWRFRKRDELAEIRTGELFALGLVVHFAMLAIMMALPADARGSVLRSISLPVLVVFPIVTAALGLFMANRLRRERRIASDRATAEALRLRSAALDAAANAIMITDRDGSIEWVNPAFSTLYGYEPAEVIRRNPRDVTKSGVHDMAFYSQLWKTLLAGETWRGRITNRRKDGRHVEVELAITPLRDASGEIAHFIAVEQDLTNWRALEQRLALAQKMESVGQLAGGVAHDFNNLLTVINGTLDFVLSELPQDHRARADLEEARNAGESAATLTRQLLAFSRRQVLRKETVDLNQLILDMHRMLRRLIGEDITVVTTLHEDGAHVVADRGQLEQVIINLVVNARDAMPTGGTLTIATAITRRRRDDQPPIGEDAPESWVRLIVSDDGVGIDPAVQDRIFDPFFTTKPAGRGIGLGLATVYGIVVQSGGELRLDSELGKGARFEIMLPGAAAAEPQTKKFVRQLPSAMGSETILLVEDEPAIRSLAERVLRRSGYTVLTAGTGAEALDVLARHGSDVTLLFTDIVMPGMSGIDLMTEAEALHPQLKVLFASGYTDDILVEHGLAGDADHFLAKPYTVDGLTTKIRSVLDS